jgi:hypothetical protein
MFVVPLVNAGSVHSLSDFVRSLVAQVPCAARTHEVLTSSRKWLQFLERQEDTLSGKHMMAVKVGKFGNVGYNSEQLVRALVMTDMMRNRAKLRSMLKMAASYLLDEDAAREITAALDQQHAMPSASTLTRHQLCVVCAFMIRCARRLDRLLRRKRGVLWMNSLDASPQRGSKTG